MSEDKVGQTIQCFHCRREVTENEAEWSRGLTRATTNPYCVVCFAFTHPDGEGEEACSGKSCWKPYADIKLVPLQPKIEPQP